MKKFLAFLMVGISVAQAQVPTINSGTSGITPPTGTTTIHNMWDDGHVNVPLQFGFPYFGKTFTNSVMYDNGVVGFFSPATPTTQAIGCDPAVTGYCGGNQWYSQQFTTTLGPSWNYMIAPLHTDMRPVTGSIYSTTGDTSQMTYRWQNVGEYYNPSNLNTFSLQIKPSGFIGVDYEKINLGQSNVSVGLTGDLYKGEYAQNFWAPAGTIVNSIPNWNVNGTGVDQCTIDPLSSPTCPLYFTTQCSISPLYNAQCPGYTQAYFTQQCSANPLYDPQCAGYAAAYLDYQCKQDPLYATQCPGYEQAYFDKQCKADALYDKTCPGYAEAYALKYVVVTTVAEPTTTTSTSTTTTTSTPTVDSSGEIKVAVVADQNVNNVITTTATSASPAQAATATVPLVSTTNTAAETKVVAAVEAKTEEKKDASNASVSSTSTAQNTSTETKPAAPTARQELQAKREAAAKAKAVEEGKNLANEMGKVADMESQKQVQNVVIQAMGFTPGFDAYSKVMIPQTVGYKPFTVYNNQVNVDNRRLGRGLTEPSDRLHSEMVDSQYNR